MRKYLFLLIYLSSTGCSTDHDQPVETSRRAAAVRAGSPLADPSALLLSASRGADLVVVGRPRVSPPPEVTVLPAYTLFVVEAASGRVRPVEHPLPATDAAISLDGERLAIVQTDGVLLEGPTAGPYRVVARRALPGLAHAPDGRTLVYVCGQLHPESDLCLADLSSGRRRRLWTSPGPDDRPSFAADGSRVLFARSHRGVAGLTSVSPSGNASPRRITNGGLSANDIVGPRFVPLPVGPRGAVWPRSSALVFDSGEAVVSVRDGKVRSLAPSGALVAPAHRADEAVLVTVSDGQLRRREVRP